MPKIKELIRELSQPTMEMDSRLRLRIEKRPDGVHSPNLADAVVMCCYPLASPLVIPPGAGDRLAQGQRQKYHVKDSIP